MKSLHHSFNIELAEKYGMAEAVLIHHFQHWVTFNQRLKRNLHEGRTWTYQTLEEIAAHFPYWTPDQVRDILYKLEHGKPRKSKLNKKLFEPVIKKGNFNKNKYDQTVWYAFNEEKAFIDKKTQAHREKGKSPDRIGEIPTPIPHTKPHTKETTNNKEHPCPIDKSSTSWISTSRKQGRILSNKKLNNKKETTSNKEKKPVASEVSDNLLLFSSEKGKAIHLKLNESLAKGYLTKDKFDIACKHLKHHEQKKTLSTKGFKYFTYLAHKEIEIIIPPPTAEELHDKFCKARQTELQKIYERDVNKKVFYTIIGKEEFGCFISGRGVYIKFSTMSEDNFNLLKKNLTNLVNWTYKSTHAA